MTPVLPPPLYAENSEAGETSSVANLNNLPDELVCRVAELAIDRTRSLATATVTWTVSQVYPIGTDAWSKFKAGNSATVKCRVETSASRGNGTLPRRDIPSRIQSDLHSDGKFSNFENSSSPAGAYYNDFTCHVTTTYDDFKEIATRITRSLGYDVWDVEENKEKTFEWVLTFKLSLAYVPAIWDRQSSKARPLSTRFSVLDGL
tara:strand:- start:15590 stop:16201 length:612 start_codon:yes stop_codon:yes gene_type:complete